MPFTQRRRQKAGGFHGKSPASPHAPASAQAAPTSASRSQQVPGYAAACRPGQRTMLRRAACALSRRLQARRCPKTQKGPGARSPRPFVREIVPRRHASQSAWCRISPIKSASGNLASAGAVKARLGWTSVRQGGHERRMRRQIPAQRRQVSLAVRPAEPLVRPAAAERQDWAPGAAAASTSSGGRQTAGTLS